MATGTGKTYTCLGAITELCRTLDHKLAVFIVAPFKHLVEQWVEDLDRFNVRPIVGYSSSPQKDWKKRLEEAVRDQKLRVRDREFFCFVCTNATFASNFVQTQVGKLGSNALIVATRRITSSRKFRAERSVVDLAYRLALSLQQSGIAMRRGRSGCSITSGTDAYVTRWNKRSQKTSYPLQVLPCCGHSERI